MKRILFYLRTTLVAIVAAAVIFGCTNNGNNPEPPLPDKDELTLQSDPLNFSSLDDRTITVRVTTTAQVWSVSEQASWVTITPLVGYFTVKVDEYTLEQAEALNYEPRTSRIMITAGTAEEQYLTITQSAPQKTVYSLTTDPVKLLIDAQSTSELVTITTNARGVTVSNPGNYEWITDASITGDILMVTVTQFIGAEDREGYLILDSDDLQEPYTLEILKSPIPLLNLEGTWSWTGDRMNFGGPDSGLIDIVYDEEHGFYLATPMTDYLTGLEFEPGGFALRVDDQNNLTFGSTEKLHMFKSIEDSGEEYWYSYYNCVGFHMDSYFFNMLMTDETVVEVQVEDEGNRIVFPLTVDYGGEQLECAFGFGGAEYDPETGDEQTEYTAAFGVWSGLTLERVED